MTLAGFAGYAAKAVSVLGAGTTAAIASGLLVGPNVGYATGAVTVLHAAITYLVRNTSPARDQ